MDKAMNPINSCGSLRFRNRLPLAEGVAVRTVRYVISALDDLFVALPCLLLGYTRRAANSVPDRVTSLVRDQLKALRDVIDAVKGPALELFHQEITEDDINRLVPGAFKRFEGQPQREHALRASVSGVIGESNGTVDEFVVQPVVHGRDGLVPRGAVQVLRMRRELGEGLKSGPARDQRFRVLDVLIEFLNRCLNLVRARHGSSLRSIGKFCRERLKLAQRCGEFVNDLKRDLLRASSSLCIDILTPEDIEIKFPVNKLPVAH